MRLTANEVSAIKNCFASVFGAGRIYLFGSRANDRLKGGDIDLYLIPEVTDNLYDKKISFIISLKKWIGDQKIDVLVANNTQKSIEIEALRTGVLL